MILKIFVFVKLKETFLNSCTPYLSGIFVNILKEKMRNETANNIAEKASVHASIDGVTVITKLWH